MTEIKTRSRPIIAITGSAGKSTTKEMLASILQTRWTILKSLDNWNFINHTRRYKSLIRAWHKAIVLEYGMSNAGNIKRHCQIIRPNIGIITNVGTAHIGSFGGDIHRLAAAKSELITWMMQTGTLILNADNQNSKLLQTKNFKGKIFTVGIHHPANYRATNVHYTKGGMGFSVEIANQNRPFSIPIYGVHQVYNALNAIAVAHQLGFTNQEIRLGLRTYQRMQRRLTVHHLASGRQVIDDSFSANPQATKAALDVLATIGKGKNVAVLGTMLALGPYSRKGHEEVGTYLARKNVHYLLTYGNLAKRIGTSAVASGFSRNCVWHFIDRVQLNRMVFTLLKPKTTVLVKGSHGVGMRNTVDYLLRHARRTKGNPTTMHSFG